MPELFKPLQIALPFLLTAMLVEIWSGRAHYEIRDTTASLSMGVLNLVFSVLVGFISLGVLGYTEVHLGLFDWGWSWPVFALCYLVNDFCGYCEHRAKHECRWFWAVHNAHHSSQHFNYTTAVRNQWTGNFSGTFLFRVPLALLGFPLEMIVFITGLSTVYQLFVHTELVGKLPRPIEFLFNTPSHHRVHHANNPRYLDTNYGNTFIVWDRLFGTFAEESETEACRYGLVKNLGSFNPVRIALHEALTMFGDVLQPGLTLRERAMYLVGLPGWSHDGSRKTTPMIRAEAGLGSDDPV